MQLQCKPALAAVLLLAAQTAAAAGDGRVAGEGAGAIAGRQADSDNTAGQLARLESELRITQMQRPAWQALAAAVRGAAASNRNAAQDMIEEMGGDAFFDRPLPERLSLHESHLRARMDQIASLRSAAERLYALLDERQKAAADEAIMPLTGIRPRVMGLGGMMGRDIIARGMLPRSMNDASMIR